jgi:hypothetical protein
MSMDEEHDYYEDEEETLIDKLRRFHYSGYVFSESEKKVLRELSVYARWKRPTCDWGMDTR